MGVRTKIDPIDRDVKLIVDELLSPAGRSKQFAEAAQEFLDDADNTNRQVLGRVPRHHTFVDGREGVALASVRPDGIIVREYELIFDVLVFISDILRTMSPVGRGPDKRPGHPGFFKASHLLFADGREVAVSETVPDATEYVFLSSAPYARRIEKRSTVYEMAAAKAAARFGNIARVSFGWRAPIAGKIARGKAGDRSTGRVPAIIVTIGR